MPNQSPLNPDALTRRDIVAGQIGAWIDEWDDGKADTAHVATHVANRLAENGITILAVAQPEVNSVESIPAQVQVISWEEEPEHECWKLAPDETFVGLIVKSDRAWSPADKYTLSIERPEVKP